MCAFPFLHYHHKYPITTFYQEWWSALLGVLALSGLLARDFWRQAEIPRIVQLPVALIAVVLLQMALGMVTYAAQGMVYIMYLLFAALMMVLGARLRDHFGIERLAMTLSLFLLSGAELSALVGVAQHFHLHTPLDVVVVAKLSGTVYGNLAQPNHFASYTTMGLISLGLLLQQRKLHVVGVALLSVPLLFVMTLSGSRSSWLYLLLMSVLAVWAGWRKPEFRSLIAFCLSMLAGFAAMHWFVKLPFMSGVSDVNTLQRFSGEDAYGGIRLALWHEAWLMFSAFPWLGTGFGQFAWQHFQLGASLQRSNLVGLFNNAHNLIFQLAAETGIAGLSALFALLGVWLYGLRHVTVSAARWWGYAVLGVMGIHSLLEYPLWYVYFLAVAAILLGAMDETRYRLVTQVAGRMALMAVLSVSLLFLFLLRSAYLQLEGAVVMRAASSQTMVSLQHIQKELREVQGAIFLTPYAELLNSSLISVNEANIKGKLALNSRVVRQFPTQAVVYRQAMLLAQSGQMEAAQSAWRQAFWSYPYAQKEYGQLEHLAEKDPEHFSALLEFHLQKEMEHARAVHNK